jgi:Family of unknown function (DUF5677)
LPAAFTTIKIDNGSLCIGNEVLDEVGMNQFELLKRLCDVAVAMSTELSFNKESNQDRNLIALYCSIIELSSSVILLIDNRGSSAIPIVFRSLLEAYVDFKNLMKDSSYNQFMQAAYLSEWCKILKEASKKANRFLGKLASDVGLGNVAAGQLEALKDLETRGFKPLNHFERFKRAGMEDEYRSIYNQVCSQSHNNLRALIDRHIDMNEDDFHVILFKEKKPSELSSYVLSTSEILIGASQEIHGLYGIKKSQPFSELDKQLQEIRMQLIATASPKSAR